MLKLRSEISKVTNRDKAILKKEVFIEQEQLQVLSVYFRQVKKAQKKLTMWHVKVTDDNVVIHVVD